MGELAIQSSGCMHLIIRTAWVFSEYGNNFLTNILRLATTRDELRIVNDQIGCPTYCQDIAKAIIYILNVFKLEDINYGVYHYSGNLSCSWADFAKNILDIAHEVNVIKIRPKLVSVTTSEFPTPAKRPAKSHLNSDKLMNIFGIRKSDIITGIRSSLEAIKKRN